MIIEYVGVSEINGSLVVLDGVKGASYEEIVTIKLADGTARQGRVVQIEGERIVVQVFEGTSNISLENTATILTGRPMEMPLSPEIVGRILDGAGRPIDGLGPIYPETRRDINGTAINPVSRVYGYDVVITTVASAGDAATVAAEAPKLCKSVYAAGGNLPVGHEPNGGVTTLFVPKAQLPKGNLLIVAVRPVTSLGTSGRPISISYARA